MYILPEKIMKVSPSLTSLEEVHFSFLKLHCEENTVRMYNQRKIMKESLTHRIDEFLPLFLYLASHHVLVNYDRGFRCLLLRRRNIESTLLLLNSLFTVREEA